MDYAEAQAAVFTPREGQIRPLDWTTPARRLRDAIEPLATVCFWSEPAYDAYATRPSASLNRAWLPACTVLVQAAG